MQKQRSPFTVGNLNLDQFRGSNLNSMPMSRMPILLQFGQQGSGMQSMMSVSMNQSLEPEQRWDSPCSHPIPKVSLQEHYNGLYEGDRLTHHTMHESIDQPIDSTGYNSPTAEHDEFLLKGKLLPVRRKLENFANDSDSADSELEPAQTFDFPKESRFYRVLDYIKATMPQQRQERMLQVINRCNADTWLIRVLLMLRLLGLLTGAAVEEGVYLGINVTQLSFRLWRCKFQLRSLLRQLLWRMAGAKGNDALLFLGVMIMSPWLFLISLVGFAIAFVFVLKDLFVNLILYK